MSTRIPKRLVDYPGAVVRLRCEQCGRCGRYQKWELMKRLGAGIDTDQLIWILAYSKCRRLDKRKRCQAYFADLRY
jgi:hypothetical protein